MKLEPTAITPKPKLVSIQSSNRHANFMLRPVVRTNHRRLQVSFELAFVANSRNLVLARMVPYHSVLGSELAFIARS